MPWTETTRCQYERNNERYSSDVTDAEWAVIFPFLPGPNKLGRPREVELREVWDGIGYIAAAGCAWLFCQRTFRRFQRFDTISTTGVIAGYWRRSTTLWSLWRVNGRLGIINPRQALLTVKA